MAKYYVYNNATRRLKTNGFVFAFDVIEQFAGSWRGVLKLTNDKEIEAADKLTSIGVIEITEAEYENYLKKKLNSTPLSPTIIRLPVSPIKEAAGVVVIKVPSNPTTPKGNLTVEATKTPIAEAIVLGEAIYVDPLDQRSGKKRGKRT